jgi:hypothetical protein
VHALSQNSPHINRGISSLFLAFVAALVVAVVAPSARAADPVCARVDPNTGQCTLWVTVPGPTPPPTPGDPPTGNTGDTGPACYSDGSNLVKQGPVPCQDNGHWWSNANQCYMWLADPQPPANDPAWGGHYPDGAIYGCQVLGYGAIPVWLANPPDRPGTGPTPYQVAQLAIKQMNMHAITVGLAPMPTEANPKAMGVIGVPVWMWVQNPTSTTYGPIGASASAGGITVTATATVERVAWDMGDGSAPINCGQGTPYNSSVDGTKPSPDCGYTYQKTSWNKPNHEYTVTANSYWKVDWAGAGQQGTIRLPALVSTVHIKEGELQVLNNHG